MQLSRMINLILDESSTKDKIENALDDFADSCSHITDIIPDRSDDGWAGDTYLYNGMAINPGAAAYCIMDYERSTVFLRATYAAILAAKKRFSPEPIKLLYAGCGPFATLLLPLLPLLQPDDIDITLLDIHQESLDSVTDLLSHFGFDEFTIQLINEDACTYQHPTQLHIIIAEVMQKALEQEPQFVVTANLAPQLCDNGIFIPEKIEVEFALADLAKEAALFTQEQMLDSKRLINTGRRYSLVNVLTLTPSNAPTIFESAKPKRDTKTLELPAIQLRIPSIEKLSVKDAALFTHIQVFQQYQLLDYQSAITLPHKCYDLSELKTGDTYHVTYQLGNYPRFDVSKAEDQIGT